LVQYTKHTKYNIDRKIYQMITKYTK
jgi:hypothetical protein